jgi:tRNA (guanine-N7-)-methyltransferase
VTDARPHHNGVLPRGVRTFKPRRSRISERQSVALREQATWLIDVTREPLHLASIWGPGIPVVLEIGFGTGGATAQMAAADPGTGILALDIHTPGVGNLLDLIARGGLTNVRVMEADALDVLAAMIEPATLSGVRSFFPDPWPKTRHHKRRLVQQPILDLVRRRLVPGGTWHIATDWAAYAASMQELFDADPSWSGGAVDRPGWRPQTPYERRALREGRHIVDLVYRTADAGRIGS